MAWAGHGLTVDWLWAVCLPSMQLKQLEELEQEQDLLLQGLAMMARGRDWYQQQLKRVQERQRRLGQSKASAVSVPGQPIPGMHGSL